MTVMTTLSMPKNGRTVIPATMRTELNIQTGKRLYLEVRDGDIFMTTAAQHQTQRRADRRTPRRSSSGGGLI
jgi:bifunctional DNA-binding transcriptional regulator/antitoxin component of YhaV-PrlF toxin-antitoxin module